MADMNKSKDLYRINAGELCVSFEKKKGGLWLYSVRDKKTKKNYLTHEMPFFSLCARNIKDDSFITAESTEGWAYTHVLCLPDSAVISLSDNEALPGVSVTITASVSSGENRISWSTVLASVNDEWTLFECDYPVLGFDTSSHVDFFSPYGSGEVYGSNEHSEYKFLLSYPSYGVSMQYMAYLNAKEKRGIYYGLHDSAPAFKKFSITKKDKAKAMLLKASMPLCDIGLARNSQALAGTVVWQLFDGDWYDAAVLYRDWVEASACWLPEMKDGVRADIPEWMLKNTFWWLYRINDKEDFTSTVLEVNKELGVKAGVHIYDWFKIPYDNDYPHYFPAKDIFAPGVKTLQEAGLRCMPYINGRLWDTKDRGMEDWQFSSVAKPNCTKNHKGEPFIESYNSVEEDGSKAELSIMCPSTAVWQEKIREITYKLYNEIGVDAVYIDQIAAAAPYICEDRTHSHRPGGGTWWCEGYRNLLDHVRQIKPADRGVTSECTADPFMKNIQGYLTWLWVKGNQVPAFPAIYAGYVMMFGNRYDSIPEDCDEGQRILISQSFVYGEQLGWIKPHIFKAMKNRDFFIRVVRMREQLGEYFYAGRMERPPVIECDLPELYTDKSTESMGRILRYSPVFGGLWTRNRDGKRLLCIINAAEETAHCRIETVLPDAGYTAWTDSGDRIKLTVSESKAEVSIPKLSVLYVES